MVLLDADLFLSQLAHLHETQIFFKMPKMSAAATSYSTYVKNLVFIGQGLNIHGPLHRCKTIDK